MDILQDIHNWHMQLDKTNLQRSNKQIHIASWQNYITVSCRLLPLLMMFSSFFRVKILCVFTNLIYQAVSEVYVDGAKGLKRDTKNGVAYANFAAHTFSHLDLPPLVSASVKEFRECGQLCVDHSSCFSFNCATFLDNVERKILCQLLQSDKYNKSSKFAPSARFHHFSIKVGEKRRGLLFLEHSFILFAPS